MRTIYSLFLIVLLPAVAAAGALDVQPAITQLVPTNTQLVDMCATSGTYDACTRFVAYRLEASCYETERGWSMDASATFRPFIVLRNFHQVAHEQEHIADVRQSADAYLVHLANMVFTSHEACAAAAFDAKNGFAEQMSSFALASNVLRHPRVYGRPTKPLVTGTLRPASIADTSVAMDVSRSVRGRR